MKQRTRNRVAACRCCLRVWFLQNSVRFEFQQIHAGRLELPCLHLSWQALPLEQGSLLAVCIEGALLHVPRLSGGALVGASRDSLQLQAGFCGGPGEGGPRRHGARPGQGRRKLQLPRFFRPAVVAASLPSAAQGRAEHCSALRRRRALSFWTSLFAGLPATGLRFRCFLGPLVFYKVGGSREQMRGRLQAAAPCPVLP